MEAADPPWEGREKMAGRFDLDLGRCIFCGLCVEVCPEDALDQSTAGTAAVRRRDGLRLQKEDLLLS